MTTAALFRKILLISFFVICVLLLSACSSDNYAPVSDRWDNPSQGQGTHVVAKGETLYSVAWRYGLDYRDLARYNHVPWPYRVHAGQRLHLTAARQAKAKTQASTATRQPTTTTKQAKPAVAKTTTAKRVAKTAASSTSKPTQAIKTKSTATASRWRAPKYIKSWRWPSGPGTLLSTYHPRKGSKGIDIAGQLGQGVYAAAPGEVVYSGSGIRGYGRLIIIKHNANYLTAYGHNRQLLVKEGEIVKRGQQIATFGNSGARRVMLHFEIRKNGKPVDPLRYLPKRA